MKYVYIKGKGISRVSLIINIFFMIIIKVFEIYTFSFRSNLISKKSIMWFIMRSLAKFQPPNPSITTNCISRFWSFGRFVWKSKKLPNFFIFDILFSILLWISWIGYLKVLHVEFSSNLSLVWLKIKFFKILTAILYGKITRSRIQFILSHIPRNSRSIEFSIQNRG